MEVEEDRPFVSQHPSLTFLEIACPSSRTAPDFVSKRAMEREKCRFPTAGLPPIKTVMSFWNV